MKILAAALIVGAASAATAQSAPPTTPTAPVTTQAPKLQPPPVAPPPPRPLAVVPNAQRTPTPAAIRPVSPGGAALATTRPDTNRKLALSIGPTGAPAARVASPPRRGPKSADSTEISKTFDPTRRAPTPPSQRTAPPRPLPQPQKKP